MESLRPNPILTHLGAIENDAGNVRKRLKRGAGGEITVPCPETNKSVQEKLKQKVLSGDISVGELIVPRKVTIAH